MADQVVQEIKDRLDIAEVIGSYIPLKRAGSNWRANCPFHNEKTPSFNVNPARQIWHCFGCGLGGDVFSFVQQYEHLEFPEVLRLLADRVGVQLPERGSFDSSQKELREKLYRVNTFAARLYHQILLGHAGKGARAYLQARGLTEDTVETWQIGYATDDAQLLEKALMGKGAQKKDLVLAGVLAQGSRGTYDRFKGRITFPIYDFSGKVVGFSARVYRGETLAKYINSPDSPVYNKSQVLFGLFQAKAAARDRDYMVIVEGQMDCIKAHQAGFQNTVAPCGTALTKDHLKLIGRLTKNIKLCFDSDVAGQRATKKSGALALSLGFSVKLISVGQAKDPDELISQDPKLWQEAVQSSGWFIDHYIEQAERQYQPRSVEQRKYITQEIVPLIGLLQDPLEQDRYVQLLAERLGLGTTAALELFRGTGSQAPEQPAKIQDVHVSSEVSPLEKQVLGMFLMYPALVEEWESVGGTLSDFSSGAVVTVLERWRKNENEIVLHEALAQEALFVVESEKTRSNETEAAFLQTLRKTLLTFRLAALKNRQQTITASIHLAEGRKNAPMLHDLQREFMSLSEARLDLERKIQSI